MNEERKKEKERKTEKKNKEKKKEKQGVGLAAVFRHEEVNGGKRGREGGRERERERVRRAETASAFAADLLGAESKYTQ